MPEFKVMPSYVEDGSDILTQEAQIELEKRLKVEMNFIDNFINAICNYVHSWALLVAPKPLDYNEEMGKLDNCSLDIQSVSKMKLKDDYFGLSLFNEWGGEVSKYVFQYVHLVEEPVMCDFEKMSTKVAEFMAMPSGKTERLKSLSEVSPAKVYFDRIKSGVGFFKKCKMIGPFYDDTGSYFSYMPSPSNKGEHLYGRARSVYISFYNLEHHPQYPHVFGDILEFCKNITARPLGAHKS